MKLDTGDTLAEIEKIPGFHSGRLSQGIAVAVLTELPGTEQFGLGGYSNVASHKHKIPQGLEIDKLKAIAKATWTKAGADRLVKVLPGAPHSTTLDPGIQYPPGYGAPQWIVKVKLRATVVAVINDYPNGRYVPCGR